jgi:hypothetical protein
MVQLGVAINLQQQQRQQVSRPSGLPALPGQHQGGDVQGAAAAAASHLA